MATKAARFLVKLCRLAEIELAPESPRTASRGKRRAKVQAQPYPRPQAGVAPADYMLQSPPVVPGQFPMVLALTPEMASMSVEQLTELFRKMRLALEQSASAQS
jgi:hypothetical protein